MVSANLLQNLSAGGNPTADAFNKTTQNLQAQREAQFRQAQLEKQVTSADAIDAAQRASVMAAPAPIPAAAPAPAMSAPGSIQTNIQSEPLPAMGAAPAAAPAAPAMASPALAAQPNSFAGRPAQQAAPTNGQLSPFDTPEFTQDLTRRLAAVPGAGAQIMQLKKDRDGQILKVLDMSAAGNVDEAKFLAKQSGLNMPEVMFSNGDVARAMSLSAKSYPDEPQKAQAFTQAFMATPGGLQEKVMAGIQAGGTPSTASQRSLNNSIALLQYKAAHPEVNSTNPYDRYRVVGDAGLVDLGAQGGPQVVLKGQKVNYQKALQDNYTTAKESASNRNLSDDEIMEQAKKVTNQIFSMQQPGDTGVPERAPAPAYQTSLTPADFGVSQGLLAPPQNVPGVPGDPSLFRAPVATNMPTPAQNTAPQQLQAAPTGGSITIRNPQTGETLKIPPSDLAAAQTEGFEVVQ